MVMGRVCILWNGELAIVDGIFYMFLSDVTVAKMLPAEEAFNENCDFTALRIASVTTPGLQYPLVVGANSEQRFMGRLFTSLSGGDGGKW
ncbi:unnamed protein product [Enterobius vermicularis]|uniref:CheW-like domain-containing protein n=1 Tax=Enterobius vermicularis TaxID=51028 RepID=A0A0N4V9L4_ENTVE|nr:unnamed protein product [Enterobius vermicularis]